MGGDQKRMGGENERGFRDLDIMCVFVIRI